MIWLAYTTLGLASGLVIGWIYGQRSGYNEGWDTCTALQRTAHQIRGQKAADTRKTRRKWRDDDAAEGIVNAS
tara:strand:+ start:2111 stop:2329 length:219 start_codon:yes stop_codon:yes gene_type:complete